MDRKFQSASPSFSTKVERKIIEKNRRNQMKILYSQLYSLIPNQDSKDVALPLPDRLEEAINYIKSQEMKLKLLKEKKESLLGKNNSNSKPASLELSSSSSSGWCSISPQLEIREMGSILEVVLTSGLDNQFLFYEFIRILNQGGVEVVNANFSVHGNSVIHTFHAEISDTRFGSGAARVIERLERLVTGSTSDMEPPMQWWDVHFQPQTWDL